MRSGSWRRFLLPTSIGLGLAVLLNQKFRGSNIFRSVFYFPAILSLAIVGPHMELDLSSGYRPHQSDPGRDSA